MEDSASFGYWVRRRRKALDLTQGDLAQRVGCALDTIRKIESGARRPSRQVAERLADQLDVPAETRAAFLQAARAELAADRLGLPSTLALQRSGVRDQGSGDQHQASPRTPNPEPRTLIDWGEALAVPVLYGRERELATLHQWILVDRCRVIAILGLGG